MKRKTILQKLNSLILCMLLAASLVLSPACALVYAEDAEAEATAVVEVVADDAEAEELASGDPDGDAAEDQTVTEDADEDGDAAEVGNVDETGEADVAGDEETVEATGAEADAAGDEDLAGAVEIDAELLTTTAEGTGEDGEELLEGFIDKTVSGLTSPRKRMLLRANATRGSKLSGANRAIYDALVAEIIEVAAGNTDSSAFRLDISGITGSDETEYYTADQLGIDSILNGSSLSSDVTSAFIEMYEIDMRSVISALLFDMPYDLYWFDKTYGCGYGPGCVLATGEQTGETYVGFTSFRVSMYVAKSYSKDGATIHGTSLDTDKTRAASAAAEAAAAIITEHADEDDITKLTSYKDEICALTSYETAADFDGPYGDTWQMIYVFDGDDSTNVVCEGYSKAFQFLCDHSSFEGDIASRIVTGNLSGGGHMWNIVRLDNHMNYLADVTNCDCETAGYPDKLFLVPCISGDKWRGYTFALGSGTITYIYDYNTLAAYDDDEIEITDCAYSEAPYPIEEVTVTGLTERTYTGSAIVPSVTVRYHTRAMTEGEDYTIEYANNTNAGTATVTITGLGDFEGSVIKTFTIRQCHVSAVRFTVPNYTYDNKVKTPNPVVTYNGMTLVKGVDYKLTYSSGRKNAGRYTVSVTGLGNYTGVNSVMFSINPKGTSVSKVTRAKKALTIKWKKQTAKMAASRITGYQIQIATDASFKKIVKTVNVSGYKKVSKKISGLKRKTAYYVRVRTYMKTAGGTVYSAWSSARKTSTK